LQSGCVGNAFLPVRGTLPARHLYAAEIAAIDGGEANQDVKRAAKSARKRFRSLGTGLQGGPWNGT
jgi:hypothetical protein